MRRGLRIALTVIGIIVIIGVVAVGAISAGLKTGRDVKVASVSPASLSDGTYVGSYKAGRWTNTAEVTISGGKITAIKYTKDVTFAIPPARQQVIDSIIAKQTPAVDTLAGATVTSKAYMKSVENALTSGTRK